MPRSASPPGPSTGLLGLHFLPQVQRDFMGFSRRLFESYGDEVCYRMGPYRIFQFAQPERYYEVLVENNRAFHKTARLRAVLGQWNGNGLVVNEGQSWARQRRLVQPAFHPGRIQSYADLVVRHTRALIEPHAGEDVNLAVLLNQLTFRTVAEALFGADVAPVADEFLDAVATLQEVAIADLTAVQVPPLWLPTPRRRGLRKAMRFLDEVIESFIANRRASGVDQGDLLSMLLLAVDEEGGTGQMTDRQVRDEAVGLLLGGNETTATALTWTAHLLATNEHVQEETQREIDYVTGGHDPTADHAGRLPLTTATMKEAMRLYPPAYFLSREVVEPVTVGGHSLRPAGALRLADQVHLPVFLTHRDERWFDRPDEFVPHRFLGEGEKLFPRCSYVPFGAGPRACIGRGFALLEGTLILATLLQRFSLRLGRDQGEVELEAQVSLHPKGGLQMHLEPR